MIDTLATFADQVTTVAREVGVEGQARRPGERPGRGGHVEAPDRQREPARGQSHHAGPRDRRGGHRGDEGRPHAVDHGRGERRGRRAQGQHQRDDPQPEGHDAQERRAGLAQDQPREVHAHAAGTARPPHGRPADPVRARTGGECAARRLLHHGRPGTVPSSSCSPATPTASASTSANVFKLGEGLVGQAALEKQKIVLEQRSVGLRPDHRPASARRRRSTSSCCPFSSRAR